MDRLEEILELYRDQEGPDRRGFDELQRRLLDLGIEDDMQPDWEPPRGASLPKKAAHRACYTPA